ncbi:MAG: hypothetical protein GYB64_03885 [Chloroflexi bacterium]|nr:hypothetical protein [Chloroflexota bacterium]
MDYDYHFMVLAPGLQSAWFFQAARQYWQRFQPIVTDDLDLLGYTPQGSTVAVSVLARPDTADFVKREILQARGDAFVDMIVTNDLPSMEATLNRRAELGERFG